MVAMALTGGSSAPKQDKHDHESPILLSRPEQSESKLSKQLALVRTTALSASLVLLANCKN